MSRVNAGPVSNQSTIRRPGRSPAATSASAFRALTATLLAVGVCTTSLAQPRNWWHKDWPYRVCLKCEPGEGDVAAVRVTLAGRTTPDGRDLRLVDRNGSLRNFEVIHHDPQLSTLIQFKAPSDKPLTTWLYFGNTTAVRIRANNPQFDAWQQAWDSWKSRQKQRQGALEQQSELQAELKQLRDRLREVSAAGGDTRSLQRRIAELERELDALDITETGAAPARPETWYPRRGVLLRVYRKATPGHPKTLPRLRQLMRTGQLEGACFRSSISDGFNRFGPSEHYVSHYDGYLQIDKPGTYAFCTASDDGSWLRVNNRIVVEWPGAHGWGGAERGEKNGEIKLGQGVARVQYYHEEGTGAQMAFIGWKPPEAERFIAIPGEVWLSVRAARAIAYEARDKPLLALPDVRILNTYWVRDSDDWQATLAEFRDRSRSRGGDITAAGWSFGDGLEAAGRKIRHVYFRTGRPEVKLTVTDAAGNTDSIVCTPNVFRVDVRTRYFRFGNAKQYAEAAAGYDVEQMAAEDLQLYAEFWSYLENRSEHARAADAFVHRFPASPAAAQLAVSAANAYAHPTAYNPRRADELYALALSSTVGPVSNRSSRPPRGAAATGVGPVSNRSRARLDLTLRRALVLAWGLADYEQADALLNEIVSAAEAKEGSAWRRLQRQAVVGLGDVALLSEHYDQAERLYRRAQDLDKKPVKQAEMLAKIGSYGYSVEDLLARDEFDWALKLLDRWEEEFSLQKLEGYTFFLRGKVLFVRRPCSAALRYLELSEQVSPRAVHVPEAVWLRANCLLALERYEQARAEFQRIRVDFTESEFFQKAAEKLKLCQSKLPEAEQSGPGE